MQHGLRAIAFCKTRKLCELVAKYAADTLRLSAPSLAGRLRAYRGGYAPAERRAVEAALHGGEVWAVAATNALELGVDVGAVDLTLHLVGVCVGGKGGREGELVLGLCQGQGWRGVLVLHKGLSLVRPHSRPSSWPFSGLASSPTHTRTGLPRLRLVAVAAGGPRRAPRADEPLDRRRV